MNHTIGGSDIAAICGVSRFSTPLKVWAVKKGLYQIEKTEAMEIGTELEEYVAKKFQERTGIKVRRKNEALRHKEYDYLIGHVDRITADGGILEVKTTNAYAAKDWETYPVEYEYQLNWYLGLSGRKIGHFAVLIGGQKIIIKDYHFDKKLFGYEVERAVDFYENYLIRDIPPVAVAQDLDYIDDIYPPLNYEKTLSEQDEEIVYTMLVIEEQLKEKRKELKALENEYNDLEAQLKSILKGATAAKGIKYTVTQTEQKRKSIDTQKLRDDGLYDEYAKEIKSIVLKIYGGQ